MTQRDLGERLGLDQARVSRLEAGLKAPTATLLAELSAVLDYPEDFFLQGQTRQGMGTSELYHRKKAALTARVLDPIHARIDIYRIGIERLLEAADDETPRRIPDLDIDAHEDPEEVARLVRSTWFVPRGPIANLTRLVEDAGGIVIRLDFKTRLLDAVSRWLPGLPPLFYMNRDLPADRYRFSLAHELGHVVMHRLPNADMEMQAHRFAAELLMPAEDVRPDLVRISLPRLAELKAVWKVSMAALLKRAADLGCVTERHARTLWMQMSQAGYKTREPAETDIAQEEPSGLSQLLELYRQDLGYSDADIARLLRLNRPDYESMYSPPPAGLRLVRR